MAVQLHPLVILNASEHFTRVRAQTGNADTIVFGALLGTMEERVAEVFNSFELIFEEDPATGHCTKMDAEYLEKKFAQMQELFAVGTFPSLNLLGWYTTGPALTPQHVMIQETIAANATMDNETPLFLLLNTAPGPGARDLPIQFYESIKEQVGDTNETRFIETDYTLASEEAERIGVDHVAKVKGSSASKASEVTIAMSAQHSALDMLHQRIRVLKNYLQEVKAGTLPPDHRILREMMGLCSRLPIETSDVEGGHTVKDTNDVLLVSYLATVTKGCSALNEMLSKMPMAYEKSGGGMRGRRNFFG